VAAYTSGHRPCGHFAVKWNRVFKQKLRPKCSSVARVPCALRARNILAPPSTKLTEFELKNRCKSAEEAKAKHLL